MKRSIFIGYDQREEDAYLVAERSLNARASEPIVSYPLMLDILRAQCLYWREHTVVRQIGAPHRLFDVISNAPMSTEFAISRFLTPHIAETGWALFMDCDVLIREDIHQLFAEADPRFAVQVVKHPALRSEGLKMDGQAQQPYTRKNWSSVMLFNCDHPANQYLTPDMVNEMPGRMLHRFCWLTDDQIGDLTPRWNYLVGVSKPQADPSIAHFTLGVPSMRGYEHSEFADEWRAWLA